MQVHIYLFFVKVQALAKIVFKIAELAVLVHYYDFFVLFLSLLNHSFTHKVLSIDIIVTVGSVL